MIEKISVTNFKSHAHTEIELGKVTALVGPNGCGKTTILQAIISLVNSANSNLERVFKQENSPGYLVAPSENSFTISAEGLADSYVPWDLSLTFLLKHSGWHATVQWNWDNSAKGSKELLWNQSMPDVIPTEIVIDIGNASFFKATTTQLAAISLIEHETPVVSFDGYGLASSIAHLRTYDPDRYQVIEEELKRIVPIVRRVRVRRAKIVQTERRLFTLDEKQIPFDDQRERFGDELIFDTTSANEVPAHAMSDGTLYVLGLLTLLYGSYPAKMILLDDIEQGLHPLAQRTLVQTLKDFAENHNRQIILTSHSPYILDDLDPNDVWAMATDELGVSHCRRLTEHPDADRLLKTFTTGEVWDAEGEQWVIDKAA